MKKCAVWTLVFSAIALVLGIVLDVNAFRLASTPITIQQYAGGFAMGPGFGGAIGIGFSSLSLMLLILGSSLLVCAVCLLGISVYCFAHSTESYGKKSHAPLFHKTNKKQTRTSVAETKAQPSVPPVSQPVQAPAAAQPVQEPSAMTEEPQDK
ncbi:MAG: hypothetical protein LKE40_00590 [Spirochaetia bacterium]|jgi:hypothetical protein|nr:hypothetical protein [Spirochaetia bacterium]